jgi:hypothetical protein
MYVKVTATDIHSIFSSISTTVYEQPVKFTDDIQTLLHTQHAGMFLILTHTHAHTCIWANSSGTTVLSVAYCDA